MESIERHRTTHIPQAEEKENLNSQKKEVQSNEKEIVQTSFADCGYYGGEIEKKEIDLTNIEFHTNVIWGEALNGLKNKVLRLRKRNIYKYLLDYIEKEHVGKVCILYGLRRTGKTTLLLQLLESIDLSKTVYIKIQDNNTMGDLLKDLNILTKKGITYFLIDEVTLLSDFINSAASLSDIYCAMGHKIILSGTDSLGFDFAKRDELYDRALTIHTSYISFKEFSEVLYKDDIDEYIEYGGTLQKESMSYDDPEYNEEEVSFRDDESTRKYIDSAISQNIQRSLRNERFGSNFRHLKALYDKGELTNAINRIVEDMNHEFVLSVIERAFISHDLGSARQLLTKSKNEEVQTALFDIDEKAVLNTLKELIRIKEKEETTIPVTEQAISQIKDYLFALDLIKEIEIRQDDGTIEKRVCGLMNEARYPITVGNGRVEPAAEFNILGYLHNRE